MDYHSQPSFSTANSRKCIERDLKKRKSRRTAFDGVTIESVCAHAPTHKLNTHTVRSSAAVRTHLKNNTKKTKGLRCTRDTRQQTEADYALSPVAELLTPFVWDCGGPPLPTLKKPWGVGLPPNASSVLLRVLKRGKLSVALFFSFVYS